ncbi:MAG: LOG family protein [Gammaproteobacteria bacterium]|nr:LOG family protein [Gammaproteobacteria bacterium]
MIDDDSSNTVPRPADPVKRRERLPGEKAKSNREDPQASSRVAALINSPAYRPADLDVEFLNHDSARGARLQLDYLKPELLLQNAGVEETIVVFGGTRIREPGEARREFDAAAKALRRKPNSYKLRRRLRVAEKRLASSDYYRIAREFGAIIGRAGAGPSDCRLTLMTGGGPGIMEAANRGAADVGAKSIGLNITLPHEQFPNPYIAEEMCFSVRYFAIRKLHFLLRARALVVFPGGFGTLDELFETLNLVQTRKIKPLPIVLVGQQFWRRVMDVDFVAAEGLVDSEDLELFWFAESAQQIWDGIREWHGQAGSALHCDIPANR